LRLSVARQRLVIEETANIGIPENAVDAVDEVSWTKGFCNEFQGLEVIRQTVELVCPIAGHKENGYLRMHGVQTLEQFRTRHTRHHDIE
jgi:hypothetical protein